MKRKLGIVLLMMLMVVCGCSGKYSINQRITDYSYQNAESYKVGDGNVSTEIDNVIIDWVAGEVYVEYKDVEEILFHEESDREISEDMTMRYYQDGKKLYIAFCKSKVSEKRFPMKTLYVTVPRNYEFATLELSVVSADVHVDPFTVQNLQINSVSGNIALPKMNIGNCKINTTSGDISLEETIVKEFDASTLSGNVTLSKVDIETLEADTTSGDVSLKTEGTVKNVDIDTVSGCVHLSAKVTGDIVASTTSGDVELHLKECEGFLAEFDTTSGRFKSSYDTTKEDKIYSYGDQSLQIDVKTVSGNLEIK